MEHNTTKDPSLHLATFIPSFFQITACGIILIPEETKCSLENVPNNIMSQPEKPTGAKTIKTSPMLLQ